MEIPIYRAKRVDNNEYVLGWYSEPIIVEGRLYLSITNKDSTFSIDPTTLAIHFPDMLDNQGNKIFASLSEDGKGGSLIQMGKGCISRTLVYKYGQFWFTDFSNNQLNSTTFTQAAFNIHFTEKFNKINRLRNYINEIIVSGIQE